MTRQRLSKTNFTAGEIAPQLLGRGDLTAYGNGAALLRNVFILPTGGVTRRPGLRFVGRLQNAIDRVAGGITASAPNGGTAAHAHDGDTATRMETGTAIGTADPYVAVRFDLGRPRPVRFADAADIALSGGAASDDFRIQYSADDAVWSDFGPAFGVTGRAESVRRSAPSQRPAAARYWRIARIVGGYGGATRRQISERPGAGEWELDCVVEGSPATIHLALAIETDDGRAIITDDGRRLYTDGIVP